MLLEIQIYVHLDNMFNHKIIFVQHGKLYKLSSSFITCVTHTSRDTFRTTLEEYKLTLGFILKQLQTLDTRLSIIFSLYYIHVCNKRSTLSMLHCV